MMRFIREGGDKMKSIMAFLILIILFSFSVNAVYDYDATKQSSGIVTILEGKTASITFDGRNENVLRVNGVGGKVAYISIDGRDFSFDLGSEREVDLTRDGKTDVRITLNNIIDKLVGLRIQKLLIQAPVVEEAPKEVVVEEAEEELDEDAKEELDEDDALETDKEESIKTKDAEETKGIESITGSVIGGVSSKWIIGGVIVVIIIIVIFVVSRDGNKSEKIYNKATDLHREGQEFHYDGDDETAKELYDKASELREKARNIEGGI